MIDPTNPDELDRFFRVTEGLTHAQQATLANVSVQTIGNWRRKAGIHGDRPGNFIPSPAKPGEYELATNWNNKQWFQEAYETFGVRKIGRMIGRDSLYVISKLRQYKIPRKYRHERVGSRNPFCNEEWLVYHYCLRDEYLKWCEENNVDPCDYGGQGLPVKECAQMAGVVYQTIVNWLTKFKIRIRDRSEAHRGSLNPSYKRKVSAEERRLSRRRTFEEYRQGKRVFRVGTFNFSNGRLLGAAKSVSSKSNRVS